MATNSQIRQILTTNGSNALFHRNESVTPCPCRTPEGFRDPKWHVLNPAQPVCDPNGFLPNPAVDVNVTVKAFVQPVSSTRGVRMTEERNVFEIGDIQSDDHVGIFPTDWVGVTLNFFDWGAANEDWIEYNGRRFTVVNVNLMPDALSGNAFGHWEVALRLISG